jgi:hypothetical protein
MEKQTVRITLRMSERLYNLLMEASGEVARPLNTEIVRRLESTFSEEPKSELSENISGLGEKTEYVTREEVRELMREVLIESGVIPK